MEVRAGFKKTEVGIIPEDWNIELLIHCCDYVDYRGKTPHKTSSGTFLVTARNVRKGFIDYEISKEYVPTDEYDFTMSRGKPKLGDVIITTEAPLGNVAQIDREDVALAQRIIKYRPKDFRLSANYLKHYLLGDRFQAILNSRSSGSTATGIKGSVLHQQPVVIPPVGEQEAIAEALSDADALIEALEGLVAKKRQVKQGAMQELLTGKRRLPGFSGEWEVKSLGELGEIDPENLTSKTNPNYSFRYISLEDVDVGVLKNYTELLFRFAPSRARRVVRKNDILISTVRPNLKSHLFIQDDVTDMVCSTGFSVLRCNANLAYPAYVYFHLFAHHIESQIEALLTGSNYPAINSKDVKALQIPLPSVPEQTAIAEILSDMDAEVVALEGKLSKAREVKQGMMSVLLTGRVRLV